MRRLLIAAGLLLMIVDCAWPYLAKLPWGRLPGDIVIEREHSRFYFPLVTGLVVSAAVSLLLWLFRR